MILPGLLVAALLASRQAPTVEVVPSPPAREVVAAERLAPDPRLARAAVDTPTVRPIAVEHSDAYYTRLAVHRWASYLMVPVFVGQYVAGRRLMDESADAPAWARVGHRVLATTTLGLFTVNTATGAVNFWQARSDPEGRKRRTAHALSMLLADAGFVAVGLLAERAETDSGMRSLHKRIAIASMGLSTGSWLIMLPIFDRD